MQEGFSPCAYGQPSETEQIDNKRAIADYHEMVYILRTITIPIALREKGVTLSSTGEAEVEGHKVNVIKLGHATFRDIVLYYNKETGLLKKVDAYGYCGLFPEKVLITSALDNFKKRDDFMVPTQVTSSSEGTVFRKLEITDIKLLKDNLDENLFARP
jgi:hypothetical protein